MPDADRATEAVARWLARRTTRRSFLGRLGRGAVFVAGGSSLAALLTTQEAEARVCGQSGVSVKCDTYDCDDVWGWCWYATGCCAGGALKKICDCCRADHPNVHGYCPSGTNVLCIVESCGADPRVQVVALRKVPVDDPVAVAAGAARSRLAEGAAPVVWLVHAGEGLLASVAAPWAASEGVPLLLTWGDRLTAPLVAELQRLGTRTAVLVGPGLLPALTTDLERYGIDVTTRAAGVSPDGIAELARTVAVGVLEAAPRPARRAVCIEPAGLSLAAAPLAAALAAAKGYPLVVGVDVAKELAAGGDTVLTYLVGPEAAARAGEVDGGHPLHEAGWRSLSAAVMDVAFRAEGLADGRLGLMAEGSVVPWALLPAGGPILVHEPGWLGTEARDALFLARDRLRSIALCGADGALTTAAYYELQSIVNGFEAHKLVGVAGQGLPVIEQPLDERPVGLARRSTAPPVPLGDDAQPYWGGRLRSADR